MSAMASDVEHVCGLPVSLISGGELLACLEDHYSRRASLLATFINPLSFRIALLDREFAPLLRRFDYILADGVGVIHAARMLRGLRLSRMSFDTTSLAPGVFRFAAQKGASMALVGGVPGVAHKAADQVARHYPDLSIAVVADGYGAFEPKIEAILDKQAQFVICGMGAGTQERFLLELTERGWRGIGFTCGGYLDQLAHGMTYYPDWIDRFNLRFLYRLAREPRRLWRRYLIDYQTFVRLVLLALMRRKTGGSTGGRRVPW